MRCPICNYEHERELVTHIETEHKGGLKSFLFFFPNLPVIDEELTAVATAVVEGEITMVEWPFSELVAEQVVRALREQLPERSRIHIIDDEIVNF